MQYALLAIANNFIIFMLLLADLEFTPYVYWSRLSFGDIQSLRCPLLFFRYPQILDGSRYLLGIFITILYPFPLDSVLVMVYSFTATIAADRHSSVHIVKLAFQT